MITICRWRLRELDGADAGEKTVGFYQGSRLLACPVRMLGIKIIGE